MEHITDIELIALAAQRLEAEREKAVLLHLESCPTCSGKLAEMRQTWDVLGAWEVRPPQRLDTERICTLAAQATEREAAGRTIRLPGAGMLLRVAALIAVAVLAGYVAGRSSLGPAQTAASSESPSYVSALGLEVGESLSSLVLDDESAGGEGS